MGKLKFRRNESFYIRDGWFQKAIHAIDEYRDTNIFSKNNGVDYLGIGTNMVKSLKYWLIASDIVNSTNMSTSLTKFGELLLEKDPYLENSFSWFLIHWNIASRVDEAPIFNEVFNNAVMKFEKTDMYNHLIDHFSSIEKTTDFKNSYISDDLNIFLRTYLSDDKEGNPEDNYICPLSSLGLLEKRKELYCLTRPKYTSLPYLIVYYTLLITQDEQFNIEDVINEKNTPLKIFVLDKNAFLQYLDEMRKNGLIKINKTAGLNTVYFEKKYKKEDALEFIFNAYFEE